MWEITGCIESHRILECIPDKLLYIFKLKTKISSYGTTCIYLFQQNWDFTVDALLKLLFFFVK